MKKVLFILAMAFMPFLASAYQSEIDGIFYELDENWNNDLNRMEYKATVIRNYQWSNKDNDYVFVPYSGSVLIPATVRDSYYTYSVTTIGSSAFRECTDLTSVTIPSTVTSIGSNAFSGCTSLASIDIQSSVIEMPSGVFDDTSWYENQPEGLIYIGKIAYKYKGTMPDNTSIEIKDGTTCLTGGTFANCTGLTSVTIPNSVIAIGTSAFEGCTGLSTLTIPDGVTSIGTSAFSGCTSLALIIPKGVTRIGANAFDDCESVTFLSDQTVKCGTVLNFCKGPKSIIIGNEVTEIVNNGNVNGIFRGVKKLTSVTIGLGVTYMHRAFGCPNLTDVYCLSESVPSAYESFGYWKGTYDNEGYLLDNEFIDFAPNITLHVPESAIEEYSKAETWKNFKEIVPLTDENQQIERCATPTIEYVNGEFVINCATEGAELHYEISNVNNRTGTASKIAVSPAFTLSVYAKKKGCYNSETATATFTGLPGDLNNDGEVDVADHVELSNIIMRQKQ